jgi:hypothetical protein
MFHAIERFLENLDKGHQYHQGVRINLEIIRDKIEKNKHRWETYPMKDDIFDSVVKVKKTHPDGYDITREYSSTHLVCRVTYDKGKEKVYYWSCCGSRDKNLIG